MFAETKFKFEGDSISESGRKEALIFFFLEQSNWKFKIDDDKVVNFNNFMFAQHELFFY